MSVLYASALAIPAGITMSALLYILGFPFLVISHYCSLVKSTALNNASDAAEYLDDAKAVRAMRSIRIAMIPIFSVVCAIYLYLTIDGQTRMLPLLVMLISGCTFSILARRASLKLARLFCAPILATKRKNHEKTKKNGEI